MRFPKKCARETKERNADEWAKVLRIRISYAQMPGKKESFAHAWPRMRAVNHRNIPRVGIVFGRKPCNNCGF